MRREDKERQGPHAASELAAGYTRTYAWFNRIGVFLGATFALLFAQRVIDVAQDAQLIGMVAVTILGILSADLLTGLIHWGCDTWGRVDLPFIGQTLIRTFREHHVDPQSITRHDWAEINGEACWGGTLVFGILLGTLPLSPDNVYAAWWTTSFIIAAMVTNQFHKWAHMPKPPALAKILQRGHLILTPKDHRHHHTRPFVHSYCITTGWMNPLLNTIGFWRGLERLLHQKSGMLPREDDLGTHDAREVHKMLFGDN